MTITLTTEEVFELLQKDLKEFEEVILKLVEAEVGHNHQGCV